MKEYPASKHVDEIWHYFEAGGLAHLATLDGDQPRVRTMALTEHDRLLWIVTHTPWAKVEQIRKNPKVEFTFGVRGEKGYGVLRCTGRAVIIEDMILKEELANVVSWFKQYWSSYEDPDYTLIRLDISQILFDPPDERTKYTIDMC